MREQHIAGESPAPARPEWVPDVAPGGWWGCNVCGEEFQLERGCECPLRDQARRLAALDTPAAEEQG